MKHTVLQFLSYEPKVYSAQDRFNIEIDRQLRAQGSRSIIVYNNSISRAPQLEQDLEAQGVAYTVVKDGSALSRLRQVYALFRKHRPTLVHTHFDDGIKVMVAVCAVYFRTPLIVSNHLELSKYPSLAAYRKEKGYVRAFLYGAYLRLQLSISTKYLSVSGKVARQFSRFAGHSPKSQSLHNGIAGPQTQGSVAASREKLALPTGTFLLTNVSAITPNKALDVIVEALRLLRDRYGHRDFVFCHIGGSRYGAEESAYLAGIKRSIEAFDLGDHIRWLGIRSDVIDVLHAFDVYVHTSRMEALSGAVIEACACSLPCVVTRVGGSPEIITDGHNGYLIDRDDSAALADRLDHLLRHPELRRRMGVNAREVHAAKFDLVNQAGEMCQLYANVG